MTETEKKALALLNECAGQEVYGGWGTFDPNQSPCTRALCRAIEQHEAFKREVSDAMKLLSEEHEAFRQEVSDAVGWWNMEYLLGDDLRKDMARFIIPKLDPLVEVINDADDMVRKPDAPSYAEAIRAALAARGLEVRKIGEGD